MPKYKVNKNGEAATHLVDANCCGEAVEKQYGGSVYHYDTKTCKNKYDYQIFSDVGDTQLYYAQLQQS